MKRSTIVMHTWLRQTNILEYDEMKEYIKQHAKGLGQVVVVFKKYIIFCSHL